MREFSGAGGDQYHAFTTRLTASGYQIITMRVVAGCILALGVPAILAGLAPSVTPWPGFRLAYTVIAVACLGLAVPWLRYRWPTRRESAVAISLGTVALAAGCLATVDPLAGMVTASAFATVLGYTALFHGARMTAFTISVAGVAIAVTTLRIAADDVPTAIALATPVILICVVATFTCRTVARVSTAGKVRYEIDPLTGLLTRDAFYESTSTLIGARHRDQDRYLVVAVVDIDGYAAITSVQGGRGTNDAQVAVSRALRETARHEAVLAHVGAAEFLIADIFTISDPAPLIERARSAIAATPAGITASIGVVSTPLQPLVSRPPHDVLDELIALAFTAMADARRRGGNQSRYLIDPQLEREESTE